MLTLLDLLYLLIIFFMISYIRGSVLTKNQKSIILLVGQVGYQVFVPQTLLQKIKTGVELELYTHLKHSEDSMSLFGFISAEELKFFELLLTISGVGPRTALGIMEVAKISDVKKALLRDDPSLLYKVSGIGKKTAERIVVELKNKLDDLPIPVGSLPALRQEDDSDTEVFDALLGLGYLERDLREIFKRLPENITTSEEKIKTALRLLGKK